MPAIYWFGTEYDHQILVMQLLGPSLEQLFNFCERHFSSEVSLFSAVSHLQILVVLLFNPSLSLRLCVISKQIGESSTSLLEYLYILNILSCGRVLLMKLQTLIRLSDFEH